MEPQCEEAQASLQCLLSTDDKRNSKEFIVSLCKSGSDLDLLLQASLKRDKEKKKDQPPTFSEDVTSQFDSILSHSFRRLEEEINNCLETSHQLDTELEVSIFGRLEQCLEYCAQRIHRVSLSVTSLSCLSIILDPNASFNKNDIWSSKTAYPKGSRLTQLINYFGTCDGFEAVRQCLRRTKDLTIAQLAALLRPFGQCYRQLSADTIKRYFLPVSDAVCAHLLSCSDRQLFQQDVTPTELPASLVGPRAAYVVVESVMNLLNVLKGEDVEAQSKVQYWQDTILTRLKHALEDEANSSDSSSSSGSKAPSKDSRRLSQGSDASTASGGPNMVPSPADPAADRNHTSTRSCQTLPCVVNTTSVTHETLDLVDKLSRTISEAARTSASATVVTAGTNDTGVLVAQEAVSLDTGASLPGATSQADIPATDLNSQPSTSYGNLATGPGEPVCRASAEVIPREVIIWNPPVFETTHAAGSSRPAAAANIFDSSESSSMVSTTPSVPRSASELGNSCRVCFEGETSSKNRLIRPCRCSGSAASIHRQCLVKWIHISGHRRCEVCGARFSYIPMSERMRGFMDKFRNNRRWRNAAFAILVGLVVVLYLIIFAVFPRGIMSP